MRLEGEGGDRWMKARGWVGEDRRGEGTEWSVDTVNGD